MHPSSLATSSASATDSPAFPRTEWTASLPTLDDPDDGNSFFPIRRVMSEGQKDLEPSSLPDIKLDELLGERPRLGNRTRGNTASNLNGIYSSSDSFNVGSLQEVLSSSAFDPPDPTLDVPRRARTMTGTSLFGSVPGIFDPPAALSTHHRASFDGGVFQPPPPPQQQQQQQLLPTDPVGDYGLPMPQPVPTPVVTGAGVHHYQAIIQQQQQWMVMMQQQQQATMMARGPPMGYYDGSPEPVMFQGSVTPVLAPGGGHRPPRKQTLPSDDPLLAEYKQTGQRPAVEHLKNHVIAFAQDAHGSRFLQFQMEMSRDELRAELVHEILPSALRLMTDTFGNYVIQNFLEHAPKPSRAKIADAMRGSMVALSMHPHGCRVVQRALDLVEIAQRNILLEELLVPPGNVSQALRNTHATHVLQKTVSILRRDAASEAAGDTSLHGSIALMRAMEKAVADDVIALLLHPHAYRLVLNVLGDCDVNRSTHMARALATIAANRHVLSLDQHGNFMLQHMLDANEQQSAGVHDFVRDRLIELAQHKFGSHLVERCLVMGGPERSAAIVEEFLRPSSAHNKETARKLSQGLDWLPSDGPSTILALMMDPYANFVLQKAFDRTSGAQRAELMQIVKDNAETLGRFTYGRHILSHVLRQNGGGSGGSQGPAIIPGRGPIKPMPPRGNFYPARGGFRGPPRGPFAPRGGPQQWGGGGQQPMQ